MNTMPPVGTYLMPIQAYQVLYCHQVLELYGCMETHAPGMKGMRLRRCHSMGHPKQCDEGSGCRWLLKLERLSKAQP